ncbi:MAG: GNAT family N-acetyltransferase [Alphaproteobacteria bacterium]|nr:GNAT family N-acetyltransferase [Alphaproteobacteria bacterium]
MSVEVREVPVGDPGALRLIGESEAELAGIYPPELRYALSPEQLMDIGARFVVAEVEGVAMGCGGVALFEDFAELKRIFTTRAARGRGVAKAVVAALEEIAKGAGLSVVRLEAGLASPEAIALYKRLGYREIGPFGEYAENGSSVFMEKDVAPA